LPSLYFKGRIKVRSIETVERGAKCCRNRKTPHPYNNDSCWTAWVTPPFLWPLVRRSPEPVYWCHSMKTTCCLPFLLTSEIFLVRSPLFLCCILVFKYNPSEGSFVERLGFNVKFFNVYVIPIKMQHTEAQATTIVKKHVKSVDMK
jgi:hypothetical protein